MHINVPDLPGDFEQKLDALAPWYHYFVINNQYWLGKYPKALEKWGRTWCGPNDPSEMQADFQAGYDFMMVRSKRQFMPNNLLHKVFGPEFGQMSFLDVGTNDGMKALHLKSLGAGKVVGTEIREDCIARARYLSALSGLEVDFRHHPASCDQADFIDGLESFDVVCSYGILHHIHDHKRHITMLRMLADRAVILFTATHNTRRPPEKEDPDDAFKSPLGECIVPARADIIRYVGEAGIVDVLEHKYHPSIDPDDYSGVYVYLLGLL